MHAHVNLVRGFPGSERPLEPLIRELPARAPGQRHSGRSLVGRVRIMAERNSELYNYVVPPLWRQGRVQ